MHMLCLSLRNKIHKNKFNSLGHFQSNHTYSLIILSTTLTKFCWQCKLGEISPKSPLSPTFRDPSNWVNLFALIISSTILVKFRQNRQHFGALLAGLIYSLSTFRQQPWRNYGESPLSPNSPFSPNISPTFQGSSSWVNLFALNISSTTLAKFRQNRHFRRFRRFGQLFGALLAGLIYLPQDFVNNLGEISPESLLSPNSPTFRGPSSCSGLIHSLSTSREQA